MVFATMKNQLREDMDLYLQRMSQPKKRAVIRILIDDNIAPTIHKFRQLVLFGQLPVLEKDNSPLVSGQDLLFSIGVFFNRYHIISQ